MVEIDCKKRFCHAAYCPLKLCWAITVHKFQGFEAGFNKDDNINYIITDLNNLEWEKKNSGTAYVVARKAKSIGKLTKDEPYPMNYNFLFIGTLGPQRFEKCTYKDNGEKCKSIIKRERWTHYLKNERRKPRCNCHLILFPKQKILLSQT